MFALFVGLEPASRDCPPLPSDSGRALTTGRDVDPPDSFWKEPHREKESEVVFPGSEAGHTLGKNEKARGTRLPGVFRGTSSDLAPQIAAQRQRETSPTLKSPRLPSQR